MKVCTDACIQGAYAAQWLSGRSGASAQLQILDIGAGTGLLGLMLAQGLLSASIDAVEIDEDAFKQAVENIGDSIWAERMNIFHHDIRRWNGDRQYGFIICNPPFFENDLKSSNRLKNQAKHTITLNHYDLLDALKKHLLPSGHCCIMLPPAEFMAFRDRALQNGIYPVQVLQVKQSVLSGVFRVIGIFGKKLVHPQEEVLPIHREDRNYTSKFKALLKDYYLKL